jgi:hypothetical protein
MPASGKYVIFEKRVILSAPTVNAHLNTLYFGNWAIRSVVVVSRSPIFKMLAETSESSWEECATPFCELTFQITQQIRSHVQNGLNVWIRGLGSFDIYKIPE